MAGEAATLTSGETQVADETLTGQVGEGGEESGKGEVQHDWKKRYDDSSAEARRLVERAAKAEANLESLQRSLTTQQNQQSQTIQFPSEDSYVKHWTENGDKTEKEARAEFQRDSAMYNNMRFLQEQNLALSNRLKFEQDIATKAYSDTLPGAKEANEAFKDIPELDALSVPEKVARYNAMRQKFVPVGGRDTSAIKAAASGASAGTNSKGMATSSPEQDSKAKASGFINAQSMKEMSESIILMDEFRK